MDFKQHIVFFDGNCNLCNGFVKWLIEHDKKNVFIFAALNSDTAKKFLKKNNYQEGFNESVLYYNGTEVFAKSNAVIEVAWQIGGIWKFAIVAKVFPRLLRDGIYDFVAKHRYKWFGMSKNCLVMTIDLKDKFIS